MDGLLRRKFLAESVALTFAAGHALAAPSPAKKLKVIVAGGHPGDPEYGCGGTIAKYAEAGHDVVLLYLNRGEKGCSGKTAQACADIRSSEAEHACQLLGAAAAFADQIDGEANVAPTTYDKFSTLLMSHKPDVVFTHWPLDNHRDHRAISNLVYDAWTRSRKSFALYFYEVSDGEDTVMFSPTDYVDITTTESKKRSACFTHASQTPERYYKLQKEVSSFRGTESGFQQAEAFIRHRESPGHLFP